MRGTSAGLAKVLECASPLALSFRREEALEMLQRLAVLLQQRQRTAALHDAGGAFPGAQSSPAFKTIFIFSKTRSSPRIHLWNARLETKFSNRMERTSR